MSIEKNIDHDRANGIMIFLCRVIGKFNTCAYMGVKTGLFIFIPSENSLKKNWPYSGIVFKKEFFKRA